jgi:hypothetical protein
MAGSSKSLQGTDLFREKTAADSKHADKNEVVGASPPNEEEYPKGWKLGMIVVALALSMFLVS